MIKIAIAGNPNSGKTTFFNTLSGKNERIGNWAGVTVEKKEARLRRRFNDSGVEAFVVDLPGAYAMEAYTNDEHEATEFLKNEKIDVIINVIDASNLERSLFFTMQLIDTGIPVIVALNKSDITRRKRTKIDSNKLSELLNTKVFFTQATSRRGLQEVVSSALNIAIERGNYERSEQEKTGNQGHRFHRRGKNGRCNCGK